MLDIVKPLTIPTSGTILMPSTLTNILAIPLVSIDVDTGNNEDWVDCIKFVVDDGTGNTDGMPQLDLRGIDFEMEVRRQPGDHEVIIQASTMSGTMAVGAPPNVGFLIWYVPLFGIMQYKEAGAYVGDVVAMDGAFNRTIIQMNLTIFEGITR